MFKIISRKNNIYNNKEFIETTKNEEYKLDGIMLDIIMTKDEKLLVFSPITTNRKTFNTIQNSNLEDIKYLDVFFLEDALKLYHGCPRKVILNLLPLNETAIIDELPKLRKDYERYLDVLCEVLNSYQDMNLYLCSSSYHLLYILKRKEIKLQQGVILDINNANYIDVDFYIFTPAMIEQKIFQEQIKIGKEVMLSMEDCDDMTKVLHFVSNKEVPNELKNQLVYIANHADVFYTIFCNREEKKNS